MTTGPELTEVFRAVASGRIDRLVRLAGTALAYTTVGADTYTVVVPAHGAVHINWRYRSSGCSEPLEAWALAEEEWGVRDAVRARG